MFFTTIPVFDGGHMRVNSADWLREHMRDHMANASAVDSADNVLNFPRPPDSTKNQGAAALDLVYQVAEFIGGVDNFVAKREAVVQTLARQAIEKLNVAHYRVQTAESGRLAVEAEMREFIDRMTKGFSDRLQEIENVLERAASSMAAAEAELSAAEQRVRNAERRANEAENALTRVAEAIRTQLLDKNLDYSNRRVAAAA